MDCRKARYFLIASFDGELDGDSKKSLSYHLKDCKKCRHEAFYYRELFSAKEQLTDLAPSGEFNEKLVATIRLREAQAQWPQAQRTPRHSRKWQIALVPPVFVATAAAAFMIFSAGTGTQPETNPGGLADSHAGSPVTAPAAEPATTSAKAGTPRYVVYESPQFVNSRPQVTIHTSASTGLEDHPFASQLEQLVGSSQHDPLAAYRAYQRTRYVLPVVNHANDKERIY